MEKVKIKISEVLSFLDKGMTREEIRSFYGLNKTDFKKLFSHEKLKGLKSKKVGFEIVDEEESNSDRQELILNSMPEEKIDNIQIIENPTSIWDDTTSSEEENKEVENKEVEYKASHFIN